MSPKRSRKKRKDPEKTLHELRDIIVEVNRDLRFDKVFYMSMSCRLVDHLVKERPDLFPKGELH